MTTGHDNRGYLHPFWNGNIYLYGVGELPRTLTELAMCQLSASIRSAEGWWTNARSPQAREAWRRKGEKGFVVQTSSGPSNINLTRQQIEYVLDELPDYVSLYDPVYHCGRSSQVSCFDRIWTTTVPADTTLLLRLNREIDTMRSRLRYIDSEQGRAYPVDPFMYPLVYGRTLSKDSSTGELRPAPTLQVSEETSGLLCQNFAGIATPFAVSPAVLPLTVRARSYIPGIHPSLVCLVAGIEDLVARTVPLFEHVLTDLSRDNPLFHRIPGDYTYTEWDEPEEPEHSDDEEGWIQYRDELSHWIVNRPIVYPDVPAEGYPGGLDHRHSQTSLRGTTVKIYTIVMDINLKPGGPSYSGTPWRAAGMRNEHVAALAVHCLALDNMTPLELNFRMPVRSPRKFLPGDAGATSRAWGLNAGAASHQYIGSATVPLGHTVTYPNIYQCKEAAAHLVDPAKKGSMRIMLLLLVDPDMSGDFEVPSTAEVPPQQADWVQRALEESVTVRVPNEIIERIMSFTEGLMTEEEALEYAVQMRHERQRFWTVHDQQWFSLPFNIWQN